MDQIEYISMVQIILSAQNSDFDADVDRQDFFKHSAAWLKWGS